MKRIRRLLSNSFFLYIIDQGEQQLAKLLGAVLFVVLVAASFQLTIQLVTEFRDPDLMGPLIGGESLQVLLGDVLNLLIGLEVLQNITSYLRRRVVQIELVLLTAITAVARKVIVLPPGAENKPQLLVGLGVAVLSLAAAYWLVRVRASGRDRSRTGPATPSREQGRWPVHDDGDHGE